MSDHEAELPAPRRHPRGRRFTGTSQGALGRPDRPRPHSHARGRSTDHPDCLASRQASRVFAAHRDANAPRGWMAQIRRSSRCMIPGSAAVTIKFGSVARWMRRSGPSPRSRRDSFSWSAAGLPGHASGSTQTQSAHRIVGTSWALSFFATRECPPVHWSRSKQECVPDLRQHNRALQRSLWRMNRRAFHLCAGSI